MMVEMTERPREPEEGFYGSILYIFAAVAIIREIPPTQEYPIRRVAI
jgi:hypothetical protein